MSERKSWREIRDFRRKIEESLKPEECPENNGGSGKSFTDVAAGISQELDKLFAQNTNSQTSAEQSPKNVQADPEHLQLLKKGVATWNRWRSQNPDVKPLLAFADLSGMSLCGYNFDGADLRGANLSGADCWLARFLNADLRGANLNETDLRDAVIAPTQLPSAKSEKLITGSWLFVHTDCQRPVMLW
jgi:hypothetical protein